MWNPNLRSWSQRPAVIISVSSVVSASVSAAVVLGVVKQRLELKYRAIADEEIDSVKRAFERRTIIEDASTPAEAVRAAGREPEEDEPLFYTPELGPLTPEQLVEAAEQAKSAVDKEDIPEKRNVFDYAAISSKVDKTNVYVISKDDFESEEIFDQANLTWFERDQTLIDEADSIIPNVDEVVGLDNLTSFGDRSDDANVVYIKNLRYSLVYCVERSMGSYGLEVLGMVPDDKTP